MVLLIDRRNAQRHRDLLEAAYRFRHRHFVGRLRWEALRRPDGREIDQFDGPDAVHLIAHENADVVAYARLLPTTRPHLQTHVYPEILQGASSPAGPSIWEWTRQAVAPERREGTRSIDPTTAHLWTAVAEAVPLLGITAFVVQAHPLMVTRFLELGWEVEPLALPTTYCGEPILSFVARPTADTLAVSRSVFGLERPVLRVEPPSIGSVQERGYA